MSTVLFVCVAVGCFALGVAAKTMLPASVKAAAGAAAAFACLEVAAPFIPYPIMAGPHAAVAAILFAAPPAPLQKTAIAVFGGHIVAAAVAVAQVKLLPADAAAAVKMLIVALAVGGQKAVGAVHPPAVGVAFVWATTGVDDPMKMVGPLIGCAILVAVQQVWLALTTAEGKAKAS